MLAAANVAAGDVVLEVGPGKGVLTKALLTAGARVIAIEKDPRMVALLKEELESAISSGSLTLIEGDALAAKLTKLGTGAYKIVANIPYYITGELMRHFFERTHHPSSITLLVQKEVAERVARSKKESVLSLSVKAYGHPTYVGTVKAGSFSPPPKVDSAILHISDVSRGAWRHPEDERRFFTLVKAGFSSKRKKLAGNLKGVVEEPAAALAAAGIPADARAEDVPLSAWLALTRQ